MLMEDESSSSFPAGTADPQRPSRRIAGKLSYRSSRHIAGPSSCWTCGASSVSPGGGIAGCKSGRTQSLPARLPEPGRMSQRKLVRDAEPSASEWRASNTRFMGIASKENIDHLIITRLASRKRVAERCGSSWDANDAEMHRAIFYHLPKFIDDKLLKERIEEYETVVKKHWESSEQIGVHKDELLDLFSYVIPGSKKALVKKRTLDGEDDGAIQHRSKRSSGSYSVNSHLAGLRDQRAAIQRLMEQSAAIQKMVACPLNMGQCIDKIKRCGFSDKLLWNAIDKLKLDLELRQVFIGLGDDDAKGYILHALDKEGLLPK